MRLGINGTALVSTGDPQRILADVQKAVADGFTSYWLAEHPTGGLDALTVLGMVGQQVPNIELGTAVIPTWPRHPMTLANQALTVQRMVNNRLTLGIGLSHETMMTELGISFSKPVRHLREYLSVLIPLLEHGEVDFQGETIQCRARVFKAPDGHKQGKTNVVVAALGEQTLRVAGSRTDGTTLAWVGPKTIRSHIKPHLMQAAEKAGRSEPRIIATLPVCVTDDPSSAIAQIGQSLAMYGQLPSYRAMFEREGVDGPGDLAIAGSEDWVGERIIELADAGVTDFSVSEFGLNSQDRLRTREFLKQLVVNA